MARTTEGMNESARSDVESARERRSHAELNAAQWTALEHVRVIEKRQGAGERIVRVLEDADVEISPEELLEGVREAGRLTLNFHPDRLVANGNSVAEALQDGIYRNQFETGISSGGLTAFTGGDRDEWERRLFGGAYHDDAIKDVDRPKYGGFNLMHHPDGACPRFGSCYFRLGKETPHRATYSFGDSAEHPEDVGTIDTFHSVLAALLESANDEGEVLGRSGMDVAGLVDHLLAGEPDFSKSVAKREQGHALDDYIEAQVHGPISLNNHVDTLVIDPSFRGTPTGDLLEKSGGQFGFRVD